MRAAARAIFSTARRAVVLAAAAGALSAARRTVFLAKPTVDAEALEAFFAAKHVRVAGVDRHRRFAFVECATEADAARALLVRGPFREAKRARGAPDVLGGVVDSSARPSSTRVEG